MKTVVVTGATRGLGAAVSKRLIADGFRVVGLARKSTEAPAGVDLRICDVGDHAAVGSALADIAKDKELWGLVNAAGVASMNLAMSTPHETVERIIRTNLTGTINTCIALSKRFARNKGGRIVNFSTIAVPIALKGESIYVASKAGVEGFSRSFAREMADFGVTVNIVAPGPIDTDLIASVPPAAIERIIDRQIMPTRFDVQSIVDLVVYLLSDQSRMLSGQVLNVGGA